MGLLTPCIVARGGFLYRMIVPGGRVFAPFKSCPGGLSQGWGGGGWLWMKLIPALLCYCVTHLANKIQVSLKNCSKCLYIIDFATIYIY